MSNLDIISMRNNFEAWQTRQAFSNMALDWHTRLGEDKRACLDRPELAHTCYQYFDSEKWLK